MSVGGAYYDGRSARRHDVRLYADGTQLRAVGDAVDRAAPLAALEVSERLGSAPRLIRFADGAFCEVRDLAGLETLLAQLGHRAPAVERWQHSGAIVLASAVLVVALLAGAYVYGLPWAAARTAERLPDAVTRALSQQTLATLDRYFDDSTLPAARQQALREGFAALRLPPGTHARLDVQFRASTFGPNALALPDGTVVVLDDLVALASDDAEIHAVLAHELGHVQHRHGVRLLLQGSAVGMLAAWWLGDVSGLLATAPALLLQSRYSRDFESEADAYAAALLTDNGLSPARLADMLEKMTAAHGVRAGAGADARWLDYLSSHPAPRERLEALRQP